MKTLIRQARFFQRRALAVPLALFFHLITLAMLSMGGAAHAAGTTIDLSHNDAYGANIAWMDWSGGTGQAANGVVIGTYVCSGYIYAANVGWIDLGSGSPANGEYYQNNSAADFGVNVDSLGNLSGLAYGANIGWINFTNTGAQVSLLTGILSGYAYSANCGWIILSNAVAYVKTDTISAGLLDGSGSGLPIAWELIYFGTTNLNPNANPTGKGMTLMQDYLAGTNPTNANSIFKVTAESISPGGTNVTLTWASVPTRYYSIEETLSLGIPNWFSNSVGLISPQGATSTIRLTETDAPPVRFYRFRIVHTP